MSLTRYAYIPGPRDHTFLSTVSICQALWREGAWDEEKSKKFKTFSHQRSTVDLPQPRDALIL